LRAAGLRPAFVVRALRAAGVRPAFVARALRAGAARLFFADAALRLAMIDPPIEGHVPQAGGGVKPS
jgi:hypothetical protein